MVIAITCRMPSILLVNLVTCFFSSKLVMLVANPRMSQMLTWVIAETFWGNFQGLSGPQGPHFFMDGSGKTKMHPDFSNCSSVKSLRLIIKYDKVYIILYN